MKRTEADLVAQGSKPWKRFMIRWHNWNCDNVQFSVEPYPNMAYGFPRGTMPTELLAKMYINLRKNYTSYIVTWLLPLEKDKCRKE